MTRVARIVVFTALALPVGLHGQGKPVVPRPVTEDFVAAGPIVPLPAPIGAAVESVRAEHLAAHIDFLAAPSLEGRGLGRQGLEAVADYLATSLSLAGVPPVHGPSTSREAYFQDVPLRQLTNPAGGVTIERREGDAAGSHDFASGIDCILPEIAPQSIAGPIVFAAYGINEPALGHEDYKGLDVKGKIVLVLGGVPAGAQWQKAEMLERYGPAKGRYRFAAKVKTAAALGARAVLGVEGDQFAAALARKTSAPVPYFLAADEVAPDGPPLVVVTPAVARAVLGGDPWTASAGKGAGATTTIHVSGEERAVVARNVIATLPGSDPAVRDQAVVIGAHMDHLGKAGDRVYPGADDNASGTAALLEIAKAYAAAPRKPRRTLVFAFWTGEEEGHLGSEFYARHPAWPLDRTVAYANLDMIAHPWLADEVKKLVADSGLPNGGDFVSRVKVADFVEPGVAEWAPDLCPALAQAARGLGLSLHFDRTDGKSGGSDYRAFARQGRPFIRFFGNYFPGYHEPSDTASSTDAAQAVKIARLALATTWLLADR